jgi:hypothetical protein
MITFILSQFRQVFSGNAENADLQYPERMIHTSMGTEIPLKTMRQREANKDVYL